MPSSWGRIGCASLEIASSVPGSRLGLGPGPTFREIDPVAPAARGQRREALLAGEGSGASRERGEARGGEARHTHTRSDAYQMPITRCLSDAMPDS